MTEKEQREKFLEEVREALWSGQITPVKPRPKPQPPQFPSSADKIAALSEKFIEGAVGVSALVHRASDAEEVREHLKNLAEKYNTRLAVRWDDPMLAEMGIDDVLKGSGVEVIIADPRGLAGVDGEDEIRPERMEEARNYLKQKLAQADMGISGAHYAIAETGTLVLMAGDGQGRSVTALPPVHVAVVEGRRLIASMGEFLALMGNSKEGVPPLLESCISFITGPSRTGDIELALTLGVHGPRELHIILLLPGEEAE